MESILDIKEKYEVDESIESLETYAYQPINGAKYNIPGQIQVKIQVRCFSQVLAGYK